MMTAYRRFLCLAVTAGLGLVIGMLAEVPFDAHCTQTAGDAWGAGAMVVLLLLIWTLIVAGIMREDARDRARKEQAK